MKSQKKEAVAAPFPMTSEQAWEIVEPAIKKIEALLVSMQGSIKAQVTRANTTLADLRHRVEVLEQRQGVEPKPVAKKGPVQRNRKEA